MFDGYEEKTRKLLILCFFIFVFLFFHKPLTDSDMPWHLKTGEYILEHKTIPSTDPFSYAQDEIPFFGHFILTQYWLAQTMMHIIYRSFGALGLILTGATIFTSLIAALYYTIRRIGTYMSLIFLAGIGLYILNFFFALRPQIITFLFSAVVILLVENYLDRGRVFFLLPLPPLMLLWANMHGGFIFGITLLIIYLCSSTVIVLLNTRFPNTLPERISPKQLRALAAAASLALLASLVNPNSYRAFQYALFSHAQHLFDTINEYQSPFAMLKQNPSPMIFSYWSTMPFVLILSAYFIKKRIITPLVLLIFSLLLSFWGIRYIALFAIVLISVLRHVPFSLGRKISPKAATLVNAFLIIVFFSLSLAMARKYQEPYIHTLETSHDYAVRASQFLISNNIHGNIFSSYNKSSYLLFRLFPSSRLYADSRFITEKRIATMLAIEGEFDSVEERLATLNRLLPSGTGTISISGILPPLAHPFASAPTGDWESVLESIQAEIIVHEALNQSTGIVYPLVYKLILSENWKLVFMDGSVMIFVINSDKYSRVIERFNIPKSAIYDEIVLESVPFLGKANAEYYANIALAQLLRGRAGPDTRLLIETALQIDRHSFMASYADALHTLLAAKQVTVPKTDGQ